MSRLKIMKMTIAWVVVATAIATPARATLVTFSFSGEITRVEDVVGRLGGQITEGMPFSGMYTFESTAVDGELDDPTFGRYFDAVTSLSGMVGDVPFSSVDSMQILVNHDPTSPLSAYFVFGPVDLLGLNLDFSIGFSDPTASIFSSDALPLVPFPLEGLSINGFSLNSQPLGIIIDG